MLATLRRHLLSPSDTYTTGQAPEFLQRSMNFSEKGPSSKNDGAVIQ